jgi:solute carrier family 38 (sodium-coupled neutral amino acid transporter), member 2
VFVVITAGVAIVRLIEGSVDIPKLFPEVDGINSIWELFTAVPVLVTAYICHYNGVSPTAHFACSFYRSFTLY